MSQPGVYFNPRFRGNKKGALIKFRMYEVKKGDFILSGIDARNGAFRIVPEELDGAIVTNDFWYFAIDEDIISKKLFLELTATSWFDEICKRGSDGTTQRIRLQKDKFFNQKVLLPENHEQKKLLFKISSFKGRQNQLKEEIQNQKHLLTNLRQSIHQEAIQGKLTAEWRGQHRDLISGENSAENLLKGIKAKKEQLIREKKVKKEKPLTPIEEKEIPFELPQEWVWCKLGEIFRTTSGGTPSRNNHSFWGGEIPWFKSGELNDGFLNKPSKEFISSNGLSGSSAILFPKGTLLIAMYAATAGKLAVLEIEAATNQAICGFFKNKAISTKYLFFYFKANREKMVNESWGMSQPNISQTYLRNFAFALPPLEEQESHRRKS